MRKARFLSHALLILSLPHVSSASDSVSIRVNLDREINPMTPIWAWLGYDECGYTYMKDGKKLLTEWSQLSPVPVYVRAHGLLVTGDGVPNLKWSSTNVYTEDEQGNPIYDWTLVDKIFDTYVQRGMRPLVEIGFMPKALSSKPEPYRHHWKPGDPYDDIYTGWRYPPKDYDKWAELIYRWVTHCVDRYGRDEVVTWMWELWNEPNIKYWGGTFEEYCKLYDYTAHAVKRALPEAIMGGPHTTGPSWRQAEMFLTRFLTHCTEGTNYKTGQVGSPLDFIGFHAKGSPRVVDGRVRMNLGAQMRDIAKGFEVVASFDKLKDVPIVIGESDPEGCAACSEALYPQNAYRNGTMYSSYTAAAFARKYELADHYGVNLMGAVTWAFEFENQPWFYGFRELATNGVDKPVLNVFRMYGMMQGMRVQVEGDLAYDALSIRDDSVRGSRPDISALAARDQGSATVMVWHYHDDHKDQPGRPVDVTLSGIPATQVQLFHYRIDKTHSNSYEVWKSMGSPQPPTPEQIQTLERAGQLKMLTSPAYIKPTQGKVTVEMDLPRQAVSLLKLVW